MLYFALEQVLGFQLESMQLPGVEPTTATALVSTIGHEHDFSNAGQIATCALYQSLERGRYWRGLKARPIRSADGQIVWLERRGDWRAIVAIAAKNTRMCWAVLHRGDAFKLPV